MVWSFARKSSTKTIDVDAQFGEPTSHINSHERYKPGQGVARRCFKRKRVKRPDDCRNHTCRGSSCHLGPVDPSLRLTYHLADLPSSFAHDLARAGLSKQDKHTILASAYTVSGRGLYPSLPQRPTIAGSEKMSDMISEDATVTASRGQMSSLGEAGDSKGRRGALVLSTATGAETKPNCLAQSGTHNSGLPPFSAYTLNGANPGYDFIISSLTQLVATTEPHSKMPSISPDAVVDFNIVGGHPVSRLSGPMQAGILRSWADTTLTGVPDTQHGTAGVLGHA